MVTVCFPAPSLILMSSGQVPELYPTSVRNTALGVVSAFARCVVVASTEIPSFLGSTYTLFLISGCCLAAAWCSWLFIPETVGKGLPDTLPGETKPTQHHDNSTLLRENTCGV